MNEPKIISHGFYKHAEGVPCNICEKKAKKIREKHIDSLKDSMKNIKEMNPEHLERAMVDRQEPLPESFKKGTNQKMFTEEQVSDMLKEVQKTTTHRIFQTLYGMLEKKQNDLAAPILRKSELEQLEESYETDSQSPSGE